LKKNEILPVRAEHLSPIRQYLRKDQQWNNIVKNNSMRASERARACRDLVFFPARQRLLKLPWSLVIAPSAFKRWSVGHAHVPGIA
jgi:hypothetical protein